MKTSEDIFYQLGKWIFYPAAAALLLFKYFDISILQKMPGCAFYKHLGIFCPGCGGTRAVYYLANGRLLEAFAAHPFVPYAAAVYILFMAVCFYRRHVSKKKYRPIRIERYSYAGVAVLLLQWIVKDVCLLLFHFRWL